MRKISLLIVIVLIMSVFGGCDGEIAVKDLPPKYQENFTIQKESNTSLKDTVTVEKIKKLELVDDIKVKRDDNYCYVEGSVKNTGEVEISYFEVRVKFLDDNGNVLDSDYTNCIEKIGVGEQKKYEIMHKWDNRFKKYEFFIETFK